MFSEATCGSIFPFTLVKDNVEELKKQVPNIFQVKSAINNYTWKSRLLKTPLRDNSHVLNCTLSAQHYHFDSGNHHPKSPCRDQNLGNPQHSLPLHDHSKEKLFSDILLHGLDEEDRMYLKKSFNQLLDDGESDWTEQLEWIPHPPTTDNALGTSVSPEDTGHNPVNRSGCARSEKYVKGVKKHSKMQAKYRHQKAEPAVTSTEFSYCKKYKVTKQTMSREARNNQRRLSTAYQNITNSNLLKLNELKFRKKKLSVEKSEIHGLGVFAAEPINANEFIIEYVGQVIRPVIADLREKEYKKAGLGYYCFAVDDNTVIDATKYGNINRYINHSCNPNSYVKILAIENKKKIVFFSKRDIKVGEEITFDYKMKIEEDKIQCLCKDSGCKKSLN
ncbi:histone-lysine N-methyltransferase SETD1B-A-like [Macrosteles quadrilineatus]|uniref:histone-lysine N-methyltransferase SETD1B-A-like n=1 Tax=Macrosteles quadrilineatus TaxID=74068 RepID=UPI0023E0FB54|nr:histone-lysine N-methyltransferase SETD1B-A-like [Macrosteles quadrilineatus]